MGNTPINPLFPDQTDKKDRPKSPFGDSVEMVFKLSSRPRQP